MPDTQTIAEWKGQDLLDADGDKIGTIDEIYIDSRTEQPEWALVKTGLFGGKGTFVPLSQASPGGDGVRVPYAKSHVKDAPSIDPDGELSHSEERTLYEHHEVDYGGSEAGSSGTTGHDTSGPTTARRHDPLRGGARRRQAVAGDGPRPAAQVRGHRGRADHGARAARGGARRT